MRKLTKQSLDELAKRLPVINTIEQTTFIGGGDGTEGNPYTVPEYLTLVSAGAWCLGGYV